MQAYFVKCRARREMKHTKAMTMKNGRPATQGTCPVVGPRCSGWERVRVDITGIRVTELKV